MPKRVVILDPNGVEVAHEELFATQRSIAAEHRLWENALSSACEDLFWDLTASENPKLGTYTVTVKEISDD